MCSGNPNEGIELKIVMNRRIINEVLTTYLPTVFILIIVYSTNFFKPFFFEAVVTVNLTSQLVLTTLFISVSKSLPPTAYVKMIDVWLIFSQLIPFAEVENLEGLTMTMTYFLYHQVILHTFMDSLRDDGNREINHHGVARSIENQNGQQLFQKKQNSIPTYENMTQRNEKELVEARKTFYENAQYRVDYLTIGMFAGHSEFL